MKPVVGKGYSHNPNHYRFRRSLDWDNDMIMDYTPVEKKRSKVLWIMLASAILLLLMVS